MRKSIDNFKTFISTKHIYIMFVGGFISYSTEWINFPTDIETLLLFLGSIIALIGIMGLALGAKMK